MTNLREIKEWLQRKEWGLGRGQCPECLGRSPEMSAQWPTMASGHTESCMLKRTIELCEEYEHD